MCDKDKKKLSTSTRATWVHVRRTYLMTSVFAAQEGKAPARPSVFHVALVPTAGSVCVNKLLTSSQVPGRYPAGFGNVACVSSK